MIERRYRMKRKNKKIAWITIIILLLVIIIYLLILDFGKIKNHGPLTPTGNIDIFDINCNCPDNTCSDNNPNSDAPTFNEQDENHTVSENKFNKNGLIVSDNYETWGEKKLRIFSNPAYEYTSKIAPNSSNSYTFVVRNNNDFDITVDFHMVEGNDYGVNMKYKLRSKGEYIVGDENTYEDISKLQLTNVTMKAKESISYILDWKWIDNDNDTEIGENMDAKYQLTIQIGANQK